ncbi:MAG: hypothetical protein PQJ59_18370 [Spirochaetales bacterium]|nr:hypothetical protein [Spirochaetales bacterium]
MAEEDKLKQYMDLLENLPGGLPNEKMLRKLQNQCDLEPSDLKKLDMLVERHNDRADIYLHRDNVSGAIEEMERASQLSPRDAFVHLNLAKLYKNHYENYGFIERDRQRTKEEAEKTLILDSSLTEASELINEVDLLHKSLNGGLRQKRPVVPIALLSIFLLILLLFSMRNILVDWVTELINPTEPFVYTAPPEPFNPHLPREIPLEHYGVAENSMEMTIQSSRVLPVNDHWGYELQGGLTSPSLAIDRADLELRFLDDSRSLLYSETLILDGKALILPGETLPVNHFFYIPFPPEKVEQISLTPVDPILVPYEKEKTDKMKIWWEVAKPEGVRLTLEEREATNLEGYDRNLHYFTYDIKQSGPKKISYLELTFRWKDLSENTVKSQVIRPVSSDGPYMEQGESRAIYFETTTPFSLDWDSLFGDVTVTALELAP